MRLLHVVPTYFPAVRYGGPIRSVHGLCAALAARGHDVHVFTTNVDGLGDSAVPLCRPVDMDGVKVWYFPCRWLRRLYWSPPMRRILKQEVGGFDLVHLHSVFLWPTWAAARAARRFGVPYVLSPRGMLVKNLIQQRKTLVKSLWIAVIERRNIERAAGIHLTAALELWELEQFGFNLPATCVIANGIDILNSVTQEDRLSADVALVLQKGPFVLYLGRLNWKKGLDKLIGAVATEPRLRLVIAGNDDERHCEQIRRWIAECRVESRTSVLARFVSGADKEALLAGAGVFALPSVSENFGNAALEAMAAGCPVLVTADVGLAATVEEGNAGIVARPGEFGPALARLIDEPALRETMGRNARNIVAAKFGWPKIAAEMESYYAAVRRDVARPAGQVAS